MHVSQLILFVYIFPGQVLQELGKDKSSLKNAENHTTCFLKSLNQVETKLSEQINYLTQVSTGQPHEGSGYGSAKVLQMAWHRISHAKSRVRELEETKQKYWASQALRGRTAITNGVPVASSTPQSVQDSPQRPSPSPVTTPGTPTQGQPSSQS